MPSLHILYIYNAIHTYICINIIYIIYIGYQTIHTYICINIIYIIYIEYQTFGKGKELNTPHKLSF